MKKIIKGLFSGLGYSIQKTVPAPTIASETRPVGEMKELLEDLKYRGLTCETILDVGANFTKWSRMAKTVFPKANFYLVEPQVEMKEHLEKFCSEFQGSSYINAGAGA